MARYCSHTLILPDESRLENMVVEVAHSVIAYFPFTGEMHTTIYVDTAILLSYRIDLDGKTVSLSQLDWALHNTLNEDIDLYAYALTPCPSCAKERFFMKRL